MVQQVTNGIKISVTSNFEGTSYRNFRLYFAFSYEVTIENQSNDTVQLLDRQWTIKIYVSFQLFFNFSYRSDERFLQYGKLFNFKRF